MKRKFLATLFHDKIYKLIIMTQIVLHTFRAIISHTHLVTLLQGDQIGRIFAYWVIVYCVLQK
jgi:hypothetical protein